MLTAAAPLSLKHSSNLFVLLSAFGSPLSADVVCGWSPTAPPHKDASIINKPCMHPNRAYLLAGGFRGFGLSFHAYLVPMNRGREHGCHIRMKPKSHTWRRSVRSLLTVGTWAAECRKQLFFSGATSFVLYLPADTSSFVNVSIFLFSWELVCQRTFGKVE